MSVAKFGNEPKVSQKLELADNFFPDVMSGKVTTLPRTDKTPLSLGYLEIHSSKNSCIVLVMGVTKDRIDFMSPSETAELTAE